MKERYGLDAYEAFVIVVRNCHDPELEDTAEELLGLMETWFSREETDAFVKYVRGLEVEALPAGVGIFYNNVKECIIKGLRSDVPNVRARGQKALKKMKDFYGEDLVDMKVNFLEQHVLPDGGAGVDEVEAGADAAAGDEPSPGAATPWPSQ